MELITPILNYIDTKIIHYAAEKSQLVAQLIEPAVVTGLGIYFLFQGYRHMLGTIDQPFTAFLDSAVKISAICTLALGVGEYNSIVIDTFQNSPVVLANALTGNDIGITSLSASMGDTLDMMGSNVYDTGVSFWRDAGPTEPGFYLLALICWVVGFAVLIYTTFLMLLGKIGIAVVLSLGPLFISSLLWENTKGYFGNFVNLLINFGLVIVLAFASTGLITSMFAQTAEQMAAAGAEAKVIAIVALAVTGVLSIMVLKQVREIASSLAGGVSLSTFGIGTAAAKVGLDKFTNKRGRDNQRRAKDNIEVAAREQKIREGITAKEAKKSDRNSMERREPRKEFRRRWAA